MEQLVVDACLDELRSIWSSTSQELRPESFWIAQHASMDSGMSEPDTLIEAAWFFGAQGLQQKTSSDYVRFIGVHSGKGWASGTSVPPAAGVFNNRAYRTHTIGLAAFGLVRATDMIYLHYIWGGTHGRGSLYTFDHGTRRLECVQNVWLS